MKKHSNKIRQLHYFIIILVLFGLCLVFIPDKSNVHGVGVILSIIGVFLVALGLVILIANLIFNLIFRK